MLDIIKYIIYIQTVELTILIIVYTFLKINSFDM